MKSLVKSCGHRELSLTSEATSDRSNRKMSELYQSLIGSDDTDFNADQNHLSEALANNDMEEFQLALDMGADPLIPNDTGVCVYEMTLSTYGRSAFVDECLKNGCSPHYANQRLTKAAINYAADSTDPRIIDRILCHPNIKVNNTFRHLTPLNSLAVNVTDDNLDDIIQCMEKLILYGASTNIPDESGLTPSKHLMHNAKLNAVNRTKILEAIEKLENDKLNQISLDSGADNLRFEDRPLNQGRKFLRFALDESVKCILYHAEESGYDDDRYNRYLFFNSIKHSDNISFDEIMAKGIDCNHKLCNKSPLESALDAGNWYALKMLLNQPDINIQSAECPLSVVIKYIQDDLGNYRKCFYMLLKSKHIDINESDATGSTALHYAVETRNNEAINELLKRGAFLGAKNNSKILGIEGLCPSLLRKCFDSCICENKTFRISMKYDNLRAVPTQREQHQQQKEMPTLAYMAKSEDYRHLLNHPLITSFLQLKWNQLSPIFYINLLLFILFAASIGTHTILKFSGSEAHNIIACFRIMSWIGIGYMILRECIQLAMLPRQYFRSISNYLELTLIALAIINCKDLDIDRQKQKVIAVGTMLLIAVELFLLCGCLPILSMSTHMLMLEQVCKSFLKSFLLYSIFVVTFSLCFYILFGTDESNAADAKGDFNKFTNPLQSVVKTVVMLTGEFDAGDIEFCTLYSYLLFLLFVFLMTIVLYNLLNGLAVSDIQTIMGHAKQSGTICRIEMLTRYEDVILGHPVYRRFANRYTLADQSFDIEILHRETLELAMDILEQKRLTSKREQRLRNNETRFNNIEDKLSEIVKRLDLEPDKL